MVRMDPRFLRLKWHFSGTWAAPNDLRVISQRLPNKESLCRHGARVVDKLLAIDFAVGIIAA